MPLDPVLKQLIDLIPADLPAFEALTPEEARAQARARRLPGEPEPVWRIEDRSVLGPAGDVPVRVYTPTQRPAPLPCLMFFHGGGWVIGDIESHDSLCRTLANAVGCVIVSVDYRLAPEHRFPAAADDAYAATVYVAEHPAEFSIDPSRLAVAGDSAGGNLAAVVALLARDRGGPKIVHQTLIYPVTDFNLERGSYTDNATGYLLTTETMRWFWTQYLPNDAAGADPMASPLRAGTLADLPPALIITAEYDPLRDEGEAYAARLSEAGVQVALSRYDGMTHAFVSLAALVPAGKQAIDEVAAALRAAFAAVPAGA